MLSAIPQSRAGESISAAKASLPMAGLKAAEIDSPGRDFGIAESIAEVEQLHPPAVAIIPLGIRKIAHFGLSVKTRMAGIEHALLEGKAIAPNGDRKSTRLNSSHPSISYAVFC